MNLPDLPKFTAKEKRLFDYRCDENSSPIIGDICKALHTTVRTLFKTWESLDRKIAEWSEQHEKWVDYWGLRDEEQEYLEVGRAWQKTN